MGEYQMKKFNKISITETDSMIHTDDQVEIDGLNEFFRTDFESYYVQLNDNKYVSAIGIRNNQAFKIM
jgi:hypothetical protein